MSHTSKSPLANVLLVLFIALALAVPATAKDLATVEIGGDAVFYPIGSEALRLTVSGPEGFYFDETFAAGQPAVFAAYDAEGYGRVDGLYTWQLSVVAAEAARQGELEAWKPAASTQSGAFTIAGGALVDPDLPEAIEKAQTFATDLIVQGSQCLGVDCTTGESFGFDTLRLKENNLRIHFNDTSTSASFPGVDWRITINDSNNGGGNFFRVDDATNNKNPFLIEANAPSNTLYVASEGRIGIQQSNPVVGIHHTDGNTPTLRLEQDGSDGFQSQTWDIAGNETNFFVRDVNNGSALPFRIEPGASDNAIYIESDDEVGIGTNNPEASLHVKRATNNLGRFENTTAGGSARFAVINGDDIEWRLTNSTSGTFRIAEQNLNTDAELEIDASGNLMITGTLDVGNTSTGSGQGTDLCIDSAGKLCACGSCG